MHVSIKAALGGMFGLAALVAAGQGYVAVKSLSEMKRNVGEIGRVKLPAVNVVNQINTAIRDHRVKLYRLVLSSETAENLAENRKAVDGVGKTIDTLRHDYEAMDKTAEERALYERFSTLWATYLTQQATVIDTLARATEARPWRSCSGPTCCNWRPTPPTR